MSVVHEKSGPDCHVHFGEELPETARADNWVRWVFGGGDPDRPLALVAPVGLVDWYGAQRHVWNLI